MGIPRGRHDLRVVPHNRIRVLTAVLRGRRSAPSQGAADEKVHGGGKGGSVAKGEGGRARARNVRVENCSRSTATSRVPPPCGPGAGAAPATPPVRIRSALRRPSDAIVLQQGAVGRWGGGAAGGRAMSYTTTVRSSVVLWRPYAIAAATGSCGRPRRGAAESLRRGQQMPGGSRHCFANTRIIARASMMRTRENPASFPAAMVAARCGFSNSTGTLMVAVPNLNPARGWGQRGGLAGHFRARPPAGGVGKGVGGPGGRWRGAPKRLRAGHLRSAAALSRRRTSAPTSFGSTTRPAPAPRARAFPGGIPIPTPPPAAGTSAKGKFEASRVTTWRGGCGSRFRDGPPISAPLGALCLKNQWRHRRWARLLRAMAVAGGLQRGREDTSFR